MSKSNAVAALVTGLLFATSSQAGSISYFLNQSSQLADGVNYLKVTISDERKEGVIDFTVEALQPLLDLAGKNFGIEAFGFNVVGGIGAEAKKVKALPDDWQARNGGRMDGFGLFDITVAATEGRGYYSHNGKGHGNSKNKDKNKDKKDWSWGGHGGGDAQQPLTFSIKGVTLDDIYSYADLSTGNAPEGWSFFAARVTGLNFGDCDSSSGKSSKSRNNGNNGNGNGNSHGCNSSAYVGGGSAVPAPPAIWLLGTAVAGLVARRVRRSSAAR